MDTITQVQTIPKSFVLKSEYVKAEEILTPNISGIPLPPPSKAPTEILSVDKETPDNHVPRDPRLIRLTGVHPFNVEPPLTALYKEGMAHVYP